MRLWEYLKEKMQPYKKRVAIANLGVTYGDILGFTQNAGKKRFKICEGKTLAEQAMEIIRSIAEGYVCVPVTRDYGEKRYSYVKNLICKDGNAYEDLAFIVFTSGTTGEPKGVMLTDENIITNLEYISSYFDVSAAKSICISRPLVHISALTGELLYALINGLTVYFYEERFMPVRLARYLEMNDIDVYCATPTVFYSLAKYGKSAPAIKIAAISGERLTENTARLLKDKFPYTQFYNVYGLTEHSPRATALLPQDFIRKAGSVGKPIGGVWLKIEEGELLINSPCVMKGYYGVNGCEKVQNGWLLTGDMAHFDNDGFCFIDGRKDDMIIRAGVNIFPQEIESVLRGFNGIDECEAYGVDDERFGQKVCLKFKGEATVREIREFAVKNLPPHLVPNEYAECDRFEYTPSGKLKRSGHGS